MSPHLDVGRAHGDQPDGQRALPQVVVEHRDRLVQPVVAVGIGHERIRQVAEVLPVDTVVRVQIRDDHLVGIEAQPGKLPVQPPSAIGHRARLANHDPRLERIEDVEEVAETRPEDLPQPDHVLAALEVGLAGDDRDHLEVARKVGLGQCLDGLVQLFIGLGVCRNQGDVPDLAWVRQRLSRGGQPQHAAQVASFGDEPPLLPLPASRGQLVARSAQLRDTPIDELDQAWQLVVTGLWIRQRESALPPIDRHDPAHPAERDAHADSQLSRAVQPVAVEAQDEPAHDLRIAQRQRNGAQDQHPGDEAGNDLQDPISARSPLLDLSLRRDGGGVWSNGR